MTLKEAAEIYTDIIKLEESGCIAENMKNEIMCLRSKYHQIFMDLLRENNIEFSNRFEATQKAFELIRSSFQNIFFVQRLA